MAASVRKQKTKTEAVTEEAPVEVTQDQAEASRLKQELDDLLDEVDEVLEENAEQFVKDYVQKGGE